MLLEMIKSYNNEYFKETIDSGNALSRTTEKEHDTIGAFNDLQAVLA